MLACLQDHSGLDDQKKTGHQPDAADAIKDSSNMFEYPLDIKLRDVTCNRHAIGVFLKAPSPDGYRTRGWTALGVPWTRRDFAYIATPRKHTIVI